MTPASATSTPAAPTPLSASFAGNKDSGAATPTSATGTKGSTSKKSKKAAAAAAAAAAEDSETDSRETKKARTNFGAVRR